MGSEDSELEGLRRIAKFFHSIVENMPDMVFVKDTEEFRFVLLNRAGERMLGLSRDQLLGKTDYDLFPADEADFFRAKDEEAIRRGEVLEIPEERVLTPVVGERIIHTKKIRISDNDGTPRYVLGISEDITARRMAEKDLDQLRATVAAAVVHELRSPLQAITLQLEVLAMRLGDDELARSALRSMRTDVSHLIRLSADLLDATRVAIEDLPLVREIVDPGELVPHVVDGLRARLAPHPVEVCVRGPVPRVSVDPERLEQILQNLLENANKYTPGGSPIRVELEPDGDGVCIRVIDRGPGIPAHELPRLFDRFYQTTSARERKKGFGLGLFITKGLVVAHGGRIAVDSELGCGSVFHVWLPGLSPAEQHATA